MQMAEILRRCPVSQKLMFSATIPEQLNQFANSGLRDYVFVKHDVSLPEKMTLDFYILRNEEKVPMLLYLLSQIKHSKVIVFASTRYQVDYLTAIISKQYDCLSIYGKMEMDQRNETMSTFRGSKGAILVVTDLAARGLDVPEVAYVIHFDYPSTHKTFVHRSGRTARKGEHGHAISLITQSEVSYMIELCHYVGRKLLE
jgi:ATP-dependent RNA helicase DDX54/DBP10